MVLLINNITIPSNYEYIRGTVNGIDTVFVADMVITGLCLCSCEPAAQFEVSLSFYDQDDQVISTVDQTISQGEAKFIYDRTQADIEYLKRLTPAQRARLVSDHKGALNISDLNRLYTAFELLEVLDGITLDIQTIPEFPNDILFQSYLDNAQDVKDTGWQLSSSPEVPALPLNDFDKWNKLEQILFDNFDIRTSRFKYFGIPIRENRGLYPLFIIYEGIGYQTPMQGLVNYALPSLGNKTITEMLVAAQELLDYEYVEVNIVRTVDGTDTIRTVDGTDIIRKVDN